MIHTIPAVSRVAGRGRWASSSLIFLIASVMGGLTIGAALGVLGRSPATWVGQDYSLMIVAVTVCLLGLADLGLIKGPRLQRNAQVPEAWRWQYRPEISSALYGAMLGAGILTRISFKNMYAILVWSFLSGGVFVAAVILGTFAFFRALPQLVFTPFLKDGSQASSLAITLIPLHRAVGRVGGLLMVLVGTFLGADVLL